MKLSSYERILRFVPSYFRNIFEMDAIYRVDGEIIDELILQINIMKANRYILSADEKTISELESFLQLEKDSDSTLEDRKNLIVSYFTGLGKISSTVIKNMIKLLTEAESEVVLIPSDEKGNNCLNIKIINPATSYKLKNVVSVLSKRIPAHIWYKIKIQNEKSALFYVGFNIREGIKEQVKCNVPDMPSVTFVADEKGRILADASGAWIAI